MKILHINTYDTGGAAKSSIRLHNDFLKNCYDSKILFLYRFTNVEIRESYIYHNILTRFHYYKNKLFNFVSMPWKDDFNKYGSYFEKLSYPITEYRIESLQIVKDADVIVLHWVADFLNYPSFFNSIKNKVIIWRLADQNPFLGICHYSFEMVKSEFRFIEPFDSIALEIKKKSISRAISRNKFFINGMTSWMNDECRLSGVFENATFFKVFNGVRFEYPIESQHEAKLKLGFDCSNSLLFFASESLQNFRKGFDIIIEILPELSKVSNLEIVCVGKLDVELKQKFPSVTFLDEIHEDDKLRLYYRAADLFLFPSRMDNLSNTILEALSQDTAIVAFNTGGNLEFLQNKKNSIIVEGVSAKLFLQGVLDGLNLFDYKRNLKEIVYSRKTICYDYISLLNDKI